jgi:hypothetical protein
MVEVLPLLPVKVESSGVGTPCIVVNHSIHANDLDTFLHSKTRTFVKKTKHSMVCLKKYKYRICACGCSFHLNLIHDVRKKMVSVKETVLSPSHVSTHIHITSDELDFIDFLVEGDLFTPDFGAKKVVHALCDEFYVEEILIPPDTQVNNHLSYYRNSKLNHTNKIEIVEAQLCPFVHKGDDEDYQPFIYHYDKMFKGGKNPALLISHNLSM